MSIEKERELFLKWHYNTFLLENPNIDINNAQYIYDYSHTHEMVHNIRENNFSVWLASANREGYKFAPVEPTQEMIYAGESAEHKGCISVAVVYKAMIGACDDH